MTGNPTGSGANLTNLPASQLTGTLPALDGSNLTGIVGGKFNGYLFAGILTTSTVGIQTADVTSADLVGAASSMVGLSSVMVVYYSKIFKYSGIFYITTGLNALNAVNYFRFNQCHLDGTWVIVSV